MDREVIRTWNFVADAANFIVDQANKAISERNEFRDGAFLGKHSATDL
jgi:hypothetical protein